MCRCSLELAVYMLLFIWAYFGGFGMCGIRDFCKSVDWEQNAIKWYLSVSSLMTTAGNVTEPNILQELMVVSATCILAYFIGYFSERTRRTR